MDRTDVESNKHCYAETMAKRLQAMGAPGYENGFQLVVLPQRLDDPKRRKKPTVYFVNSMSDVFHDRIPDAYIEKVFDVIRETPQHTYQILTKRAARMARFFRTRDVPDNAWLGVSVENKKHGVPRIDHLRTVPSSVRFLSIEPLLGPVSVNLDGIDWVIVGGESGPSCRPVDPVHVRHIRDACVKSGTPFFFKQWGGRTPKTHGRLLDGRTWDEYPAATVGAGV